LVSDIVAKIEHDNRNFEGLMAIYVKIRHSQNIQDHGQFILKCHDYGIHFLNELKRIDAEAPSKKAKEWMEKEWLKKSVTAVKKMLIETAHAIKEINKIQKSGEPTMQLHHK